MVDDVPSAKPPTFSPLTGANIIWEAILEHTFTPFEEDDDERCYCPNCVASEWAAEADDFLHSCVKRDIHFIGEDSLLLFEKNTPENLHRIQQAYCRAFHATVSGEWSPLH